ncbi:hypothetical protein [Hyphomonas sp.]|uniref:hypothetical protein n=1 Tax=Hyphomonas sp. TaxID=87 RepID=UPI00333F9B67
MTRADMEFLSFGLDRSCPRVMADLGAQENTYADEISQMAKKKSLLIQGIAK